MVELIDYFGSDDMVVDAARVSFNKKADNYTNEQNAKLIAYLIEHKHTAPFRHPQLQFRITCPIYVERQLLKHQTGISVNSISGRYVDFSDNYTTITEWREQSKSSKQGSDKPLPSGDQTTASIIESQIIQTCKQAYNQLISLGIAKEQARTILPLNLNTTFIWTGSLLAFIHLCSLRLKPDTQTETRLIVQQMLNQITNIPNNPFQLTLKHFNLN